MDKLKEKSECCGVGNKHPNSGEMYCDLCIKHQNPAPEPQENIEYKNGWNDGYNAGLAEGIALGFKDGIQEAIDRIKNKKI
jgi:hypothetical protein